MAVSAYPPGRYRNNDTSVLCQAFKIRSIRVQLIICDLTYRIVQFETISHRLMLFKGFPLNARSAARHDKMQLRFFLEFKYVS